MRKSILFIVLLSFLFLITGCMGNKTAKEAVSDYLEMYVTLDSKVVDQLNEFVENEDLTEEQKLVYKDILKKQYSTMTYNFLSETYDGDTAYIKTKINVRDLYKVQKEALNYFNEHKDEFNDENGSYDKSLFLDYKLNEMKNATYTNSYEIEFKVIKNGNNYEVSQLANEDLEKIHGIYNYEE